MATLTINGQRVTVDDGFLSLPPEEQNRIVEEIASSLNISPDPDRQQPTVGVGEDVVRSFGGGLQRGTTGLLDLAKSGLQPHIGTMEMDPETGQMRYTPSDVGFGEVTRAVESRVPSYQPQTTAGEYAGTVGEFLPGAALGGGGVTGLVKYGLIPGLTSEAAGQLTEGTRLEPWARFGGAVAGPLLAQGLAVGGRRIISPTGGADPERLAAAQRLAGRGVIPTAGQRTGSPIVSAMEGTSAPTSQQLDDLAAAAMRTVGSDAPRATRDALTTVGKRIGSEYDSILGGTAVVPSTSAAQRAMDVVASYLDDAPSASVTPRIRNVAAEIVDAATSPNPRPIPLETLRKWRTALGKLVSSGDEVTADAARGLRSIIDDATDDALIAAGRFDDLARLQTVRQQWWNLLGIRDAASRAGAGARVGVITPENLRGAVRRTQGPNAIALGRGTDLADLALDAEAVLAAAPTVLPRGVRTAAGLMPIAAGSILGGGIGGAQGSAIGLAAGAATPFAVRAMVNTPPVQGFLANQIAAQASPITQRGILGSLGGLSAQ